MSNPAHPARRWWPAFLEGECMPPGRGSPEAWITQAGGEILVGALTAEEADGDTQPGVATAIGEVVRFCARDIVERCTVIIRHDGTFDVVGEAESEIYFGGWEPGIETYSDCWEPGVEDSLSPDLGMFARTVAEILDPGETYTASVEFLAWSQDDFRLVLAGETPTFELAPAPEGAAA